MIKKLAKNLKIYFLIFLALIALSIWSTYLQEPDSNLHIYALDVGQGDAILIQKQNFQVIVDGGPDNSVIERLAEVMPLEDKKIEVIILTHPHADHVTGLVEVLKRYNVEKVVYSGVNYQSNIFAEFKEEVEIKKIPVENPKNGQENIYQHEIKLTYLWPGENTANYSDNLNDTSIVFRLDFGNSSALFSGDCEVECWSGIMQDLDSNIKADLLKIAHHGSNNGTSEEMLERIKPRYAIISLGKDNKFGFPHQQVIRALEKSGASFIRTDEMSTIDFVSNGQEFMIGK